VARRRGRRRRSAGAHGFKSRAQWRMGFARCRAGDARWCKWAREKAHATAGGPRVRYQRLPARKGAPTARTLR
jgi:hypothetical protein